MAYVFLSLSVIVFVYAIKIFKIESEVLAAVSTAQEAGSVMASQSLDDDAKEEAVQAASLKMLRYLGTITLASVGALAASFAAAYIGVLLGLFDMAALTAASLDWRFLAGAAVVGTGVYLVTR